MPELDIGPIEARAAAATPGPWEAEETEVYVADTREWVAETMANGSKDDANAWFIAHAPTDIAALLEEVKKLRRGGKTLGEIIERIGREMVTATDSQDVIDEDGDGDWEVVSERLAALGDRARKAEADVKNLRSVERMASAVAKVTPCACSAQRARAEKAEAEVERLKEREKTLIRVKDQDLDDLRDEIDCHKAENERLRKVAESAEAYFEAQSDELRGHTWHEMTLAIHSWREWREAGK